MRTNNNLNSSILNLVNPFGSILASSPSPSNILYYQSPQITSENFKQSPLRNESENCESFNDINSSNLNEIKITPIIQNIVSTVQLDSISKEQKLNLNLKAIALQLTNTHYDPRKFTGLIMRIKEPKTTGLIFPNGKIVCLGAKTEEDSKKACKRFGKMIQNLDYPISGIKEFRIENIVCSSNVNFKIPLMKLYIHMKKYKCRVTYEPECFPGLIYRYIDEEDEIKDNDGRNLNIVYLIFASGKIVIAGAKSRNHIYDSFKKVYQLLSQFKNKLDET